MPTDRGAPPPYHLQRDVDANQQPASDDSVAEHSLTPQEREQVEQTQPPRALVLHESIRLQGEEELERPSIALAWSALAAGLSMGFSLLAKALLRQHLDGVAGGFLLENLGYTLGFIIVILGRQQLFTENTMTAVLPFLSQPRWSVLRQLLRLWVVVLLGNIIGAGLFALLLAHGGILDSEPLQAVHSISLEAIKSSPAHLFGKAILAGWLVATMVWMVPAAPRSKLPIIVLMTYLIAIGGFAHIIVGSCEVLFLVFQGELGFGQYVLDFALPTLAGNVVGGSLIFALISHAQVRSEHSRGAPS